MAFVDLSDLSLFFVKVGRTISASTIFHSCHIMKNKRLIIQYFNETNEKYRRLLLSVRHSSVRKHDPTAAAKTRGSQDVVILV